jgi:hypothetical protein
MLDGLQKAVASAYDRLTRRPGYMLLTADDGAIASEPPGRFRLAWVELLVLSAAAGLGMVGVWGAAWHIFRDWAGTYLITPAAAVTVAMVVWPFRRSVAALAEAVAGRDATGRAVVAAAVVLLLGLCLVRLKPDWYAREDALPVWLDWLRPTTKIYRVLLLMPIWGAWSMLITCQFCRPNEATEPAVAAFARGCGPLAGAGTMAVPAAATFGYFHYIGWGGLNMPIACLSIAIAGGIVLCRRAGGLRRKPLLAANMLTQLTFVLAYLANT